MPPCCSRGSYRQTKEGRKTLFFVFRFAIFPSLFIARAGLVPVRVAHTQETGDRKGRPYKACNAKMCIEVNAGLTAPKTTGINSLPANIAGNSDL